jgi:hypothetical protein
MIISATVLSCTYMPCCNALYLNILRLVYDDVLQNHEFLYFCNRRVRAQFIEADDGEGAVELMAQAMNGADCSFDFVLMDNIMVRTDSLLLYNSPVSSLAFVHVTATTTTTTTTKLLSIMICFFFFFLFLIF